MLDPKSAGYLLVSTILLLGESVSEKTELQFTIHFDPPPLERSLESPAPLLAANPGLMDKVSAFPGNPVPEPKPIETEIPRREIAFVGCRYHITIAEQSLLATIQDVKLENPITASYDYLDPCSCEPPTVEHRPSIVPSNQIDQVLHIEEWVEPSEPTLVHKNPLSPRERDLVIRTILGEAANQGALGQTAVAHVILNRVKDPRWSDTPEGVVMQPKAFSAWNNDSSGNALVNTPASSARYIEVGEIVDAVFSGETTDPTFGATHYYSPGGMRLLVQSGYQSNSMPTWLREEQRNRGAPDTVIGDHVFTGRAWSG